LLNIAVKTVVFNGDLLQIELEKLRKTEACAAYVCNMHFVVDFSCYARPINGVLWSLLVSLNEVMKQPMPSEMLMLKVVDYVTTPI